MRVKYMSILNEISELLQMGKSKKVKELVQTALDEGISPKEILEEGLLAGMSIIGEKFKNDEVFVPEVLVAARAMNNGVEVLKPRLIESGVVSKGKVIIGTVKGDLHDIGKNLVKMMIESKNIEVIDLGVDVPAEKFVQAAIENNASVICCSALLTTTMLEMKVVIEGFKNAGMRDKVKIMVGGAPLNQSFADKIGADKYTTDSATAAEAALSYFM
jgi:corrinoid protein of di/trimethylamine methyltransferase